MIIQSDYILNLCTSVLALLKQYVCLFELKEPVIRKLHDEQMQLFKNVLVLFIQPEKLSSASARDLTTLNLDANLLKVCDVCWFNAPYKRQDIKGRVPETSFQGLHHL